MHSRVGEFKNEDRRSACIAAATVKRQPGPDNRRRRTTLTVNIARLPRLLNSTRQPVTMLIIHAHLHARRKRRKDERQHVWKALSIHLSISHEPPDLSPGDFVGGVREVARLRTVLEHIETLIDHGFVRYQEFSCEV